MLKVNQNVFEEIRTNSYGRQEKLIKKDITNLCKFVKDKDFDSYKLYFKDELLCNFVKKDYKVILDVIYCANKCYYRKKTGLAGIKHKINVNLVILTSEGKEAYTIKANYYSTDNKEKSFNILKNYLKENNILFDNKQINKHIFEEILSQEKIYKFANEYYVKQGLLDCNFDYNIFSFEEGIKALIKVNFIKQFGVLDKAYQTTKKGREYLKSISK